MHSNKQKTNQKKEQSEKSEKSEQSKNQKSQKSQSRNIKKQNTDMSENWKQLNKKAGKVQT